MPKKALKPIPLKNLFYLFSCLALVGSLLPLTPVDNFAIDLFSHFKSQYFLGLMFFGVVGLVYRRFRYSIVLFLGALLNLLHIAPIYFSQASMNKNAFSQPLKLLHANVLSANDQHRLLLQQIKTESPDIVLLQEISSDWKNILNQELKQYQYRKVIARPDNFGIAIFSRVELKTIDVKDWGNVGLPSFLVTFEWNNQLANLAYTHPLPPVNREYYRLRNKQIEAMISELNANDQPLIVAGDFNTTMWANSYSPFLSIGLVNVREGFGLYPTWPSQFGSLGIPIDHILVSDEITVKSTKIGNQIGSDHLPLITELEIK